ncbi:hypothetical protein HUN39_14230 [Methylocystis sp. FS]|uniref:hypothetical protein n=1 Tax=Methylocystis silviterrae TaxID=2743612 RepID=UPI00158265C3|nr:hypothetical protein [Methylocystis silviterrae]NUJ81170.1 hypothetical protein [Methylocystis silviterrae]
MADSENTTTAPRVRIADLVDKMRDAGVNREILTFVFDCIDQERSETIAKAARLYYNFPGEEGPITPGDFSDRFHDLSRRLWGIEAAVCYLASDCLDKGAQTGVRQLVEDAARELDRLTEAFDAENWLGRKREAQS